MPSPFPGMDPFIESQCWRDFHTAFIAEVRSELMAQIRPRYIVVIEEDVYLARTKRRPHLVELNLLRGANGCQRSSLVRRETTLRLCCEWNAGRGLLVDAGPPADRRRPGRDARFADRLHHHLRPRRLAVGRTANRSCCDVTFSR